MLLASNRRRSPSPDHSPLIPSLITEVQAEGRTTLSVSSTAAQMTVVSEKTTDNVTKIQHTEKVKFKETSIGAQSPTKVVKDFKIAIGGKEYVWDVFIYPVSVGMLKWLGRGAAVINLEKRDLDS